jgi:hypothetical protein
VDLIHTKGAMDAVACGPLSHSRTFAVCTLEAFMTQMWATRRFRCLIRHPGIARVRRDCPQTALSHQRRAPVPMSKPSATPASLVITADATGAKLSAKQKEFNRLVARVERMRRQVAANAAEFDACLSYYVENLLPIETEILQVRADLVRDALGGQATQTTARDAAGDAGRLARRQPK